MAENVVPSNNNTWFSGQHCLYIQYINHPRYPQITPCVMVADALVPDKHQTVRNNDVVLTGFGRLHELKLNPIQQNIYRFTALNKFSSRKVVKWPNGVFHFYRWVCFYVGPKWTVSISYPKPRQLPQPRGYEIDCWSVFFFTKFDGSDAESPEHIPNLMRTGENQ